MQVNNLGKTLNPKLLDKNKDTIIITTFENKGEVVSKFPNSVKIKKINNPLQSQTFHIFQMVNN